MKKRKPIKREVLYLYRALLKEGKMLDLHKMIGYYEDYIGLRKEIMKADEAPQTLKVGLPPLKMPKYLIWAKQYLI